MDNEQLKPGDPDSIRDEIESTRESIGRKLERLEDEVEHTWKDANDLVADKVQTIKDIFSVRTYVEQRPFASSAFAVAAGYALGSFFSSRSDAAKPEPARYSRSRFRDDDSSRSSFGAKGSFAGGRVGGFLRDEVDTLKKIAIGTAIGVVKDLIGDKIPGRIQKPVGETIDQITRKLGGEPISGHILGDQQSGR